MGKYILVGAITGILLGWLLNFSLLTGGIIGGVFGVIGNMLISRRHTKASNEEMERSETLQLREEELELTKKRVQTGEVKIHHEVVEDKKTITVPIKRQEMVIEAANEEEIRIPIKEEEIEIHKHPVKVNEVSIENRQIEENVTVTEKLKKEVAHIDVKGEADVKEEEH
ncbi:YsnF/AvaK domain-containing protein [Halalkalibacter alkaliphilus]|uniref:YsnF/AvaK domain-containing protein n=1 Tax=Halalkalibacter alkaliphilus TaxID=2917993 RepID=A0A9X2CW75_9BACI|nr:YsnF/AvaK domain-containing protein [Halalkalibacter alkaliphilus]MCL7749445.1 YsnF/AvaK domain-containing protein [Halalkalibacter alkaliphilus]